MQIPNPQSEAEIMASFAEAQKHPWLFLQSKRSELIILRRRIADLPSFRERGGHAEMFYQMLINHLDMALQVAYLLGKELEEKLDAPSTPIR